MYAQASALPASKPGPSKRDTCSATQRDILAKEPTRIACSRPRNLFFFFFSFYHAFLFGEGVMG